MSQTKTKLPQVSRALRPKSHTDNTSVCLMDSGGDKLVTSKPIRKRKYSRIFRIATYNVRSLSTEEKLLELQEILEKVNWDVIGMSEVRRRGEEWISLRSGHILYHIGETDNSMGGVGFLINRKHAADIISITSISKRVAYVIIRLNSKLKMKIIQAYAPTSTAEVEEIDQFYEDINGALTVPGCSQTFLVGDFNAKVSKRMDEAEDVIGPFGIGLRNERGSTLVNFLLQHRLYLMNSFFQKKEHRRWTWISPDGQTKNEIDFIISNKKNVVTDVTVLNSCTIGSDHRMVRATVRIDLKGERSKMVRRNINIKWTPPNNDSSYADSVTAALEEITLNNHLDIETLNSNIIKAMKEAEKQHCKQIQEKQQKLTQNTKNMISSREEMLKQDNRNSEDLRELNKRISKEIRKDIRRFNTESIRQTIEENKSMKVLRRKLSNGKREIFKLKDDQGVATTNREKLLRITENFYTELYTSNHQQTNNSKQHLCKELINQGSEDIPEITLEEIRNSLKEMKNNKAPGEDGVVIEAVKLGGETLLKWIKNLFNLCLENGIIPSQWNNAITILLHKKGDITELENYRPISLLCHLYKLFTKIIAKRLERKLDFYQSREQAGFRKGYGTNDHLQAIKVLIEKSVEYNRPLVLVFVDFHKAFDTVELSSIIAALEQCRIDYRYTRLIEYIYSNATTTVKLHETTEKIKISRGVRQGDTISPKLFIAVLEYAMKSLSWEDKGVNIDGERLTHLRFADDIVIVSDNIGDAKQMLEEMVRASSQVGLRINAGKTQIMTNLVLAQNIRIGDSDIKETHMYKYLGHEIQIGKNNQTHEIQRRIGLGWAAFGKLRETFKSDIPICLKRKVYEQCVLPVMTYGAETLTLTKKTAENLRVAQRAMERAMLGITRRDRIPNNTIRQRTKTKDIVEYVARMKWRWAGHVARTSNDRWTRRLLEWRPREDRRNRGRPPTRWTDDVKRIAGNWMMTAQNRMTWRNLEEAYVQQWTTMAT